MELYQIWIRCTEDCPDPREERTLMALENREEAEDFAVRLRDQFHMAQVVEVTQP